MIAGRARGPRRWRAHALIALIPFAGCGGDPTAPPPACHDAPTLMAGVAEAAALGPGDRRWGGAYIQYWSILADAPARARVQVSSTDFEPFLLLFDEGGAVVDQAFDPEPPDDALRTVSIEAHLRAPCTLLGVSAWSREGSGSYLLSFYWADPAL